MNSAHRLVFVLTQVLGVMAVVAIAMVMILLPDRRSDFRIFYFSAEAWRHGLSLYSGDRPNLNLPAVILTYAPLTYLSPSAAAFVFLAISVACAGVASWLIARAVPSVPWPVLTASVLGIEGGWTNLLLGQEGLVLMLIVTVAWLAARQRRQTLSGAVMGLVIYAKPFFAVFLLYWVWQRQWRTVRAALIAILGVLLIGIALAGPRSHLEWWATLSNAPGPYAPLNGSLLGLWCRLFFGSEYAPALVKQPPSVLLAVWGASIGLVAVATYWRLSVDDRLDRAWALLLLGALLASPLGWIYYLPLAVGPVLACLRGVLAWALFWIAVALLVLFRSQDMIVTHWTARAVLGAGSVYLWCLACLFVSAWCAEARETVALATVPSVAPATPRTSVF